MGRGSLMNKIVTMTALTVLLGVSSGRSQQPGATVPKSASSDLRPAPEMQRLLDAFVGNWHVNESFEVSASRQGKTRQGTATFRARECRRNLAGRPAVWHWAGPAKP